MSNAGFIAAEHGRYGSSFMCKTGVSKAEYLVHSMHMNRLSACREFCGVDSWQNGTRCRDGVKVLWCHSHLVWLIFDASIIKDIWNGVRQIIYIYIYIYIYMKNCN